MNIALCDDDKDIIKQVTGYIRRFSEEDHDVSCKVFSSAEDVISFYNSNGNKFDVLITDIELKNINGVELALRIRERDELIAIFFMTSHTEYAMQCFRPRPMDFWVKPLSYDVLKDGFLRVERIMRQNNKYVEIYADKEKIKLRYNDIIYIERQGRKTVVYAVSGKYRTNRSLSEFARELDPARFVRIYQSHIINLGRIKSITDSKVSLNGMKEDFTVGRTYMENLQKRYIRYKEDGIS